VAVSSTLTATSASTSSVASSGDQALLAWTLDGSLHMRMASAPGALTTPDTVIAARTATDEVVETRVAGASSGGFMLAVRWQQSATATGPGRIELFGVTSAGKLVGPPTLVTDKSGSQLRAAALGIASRSDGTVMVTWDACDDLGDGSKCGVFARILRDTGEPLTDIFVVPTTTDDDQLWPSVAGLPDGFVATWADRSGKSPDVSGQAVRARIIYPPGS
jgi:hypothetical protein